MTRPSAVVVGGAVVVVGATVVVVVGGAVVVVGATVVVVVVVAAVVVTAAVVVVVAPLQEGPADKTPAIRRTSPNTMMGLPRLVKPVLVTMPSGRSRTRPETFPAA